MRRAARQKDTPVRPVRNELLFTPCRGIVAVPFEPVEKLVIGLAYRTVDENPALRAFVRAAKAHAGR